MSESKSERVAFAVEEMKFELFSSRAVTYQGAHIIYVCRADDFLDADNVVYLPSSRVATTELDLFIVLMSR